MKMIKNTVTNLLFIGKMNNKGIKIFSLIFKCFLLFQCSVLKNPTQVNSDTIMYEFESNKLQQENDLLRGYDRYNCPELRKCKKECSKRHQHPQRERALTIKNFSTEFYFLCEENCFSQELCNAYEKF